MKAKLGSWMMTIGGILLIVVSTRVALIHMFHRVTFNFIPGLVDDPQWLNAMVNYVGYPMLLLSVVILGLAILSFKMDVPLLIGVIALPLGIISIHAGYQLWATPVAELLEVEPWSANVFFAGVLISIVGAIVILRTVSQPLEKDASTKQSIQLES